MNIMRSPIHQSAATEESLVVVRLRGSGVWNKRFVIYRELDVITTPHCRMSASEKFKRRPEICTNRLVRVRRAGARARASRTWKYQNSLKLDDVQVRGR